MYEFCAGETRRTSQSIKQFGLAKHRTFIHELTNEVTFLNVKQSEEPLQPESESQSQESSAHPLTPHRIHPSPDCASESTLQKPPSFLTPILTDLLPNADAYIRSEVAGPKVAGHSALQWPVPKVAGRPALKWLIQSDRSRGRTTRSQVNTSLHALYEIIDGAVSRMTTGRPPT